MTDWYAAFNKLQRVSLNCESDVLLLVISCPVGYHAGSF
jgi:hypothetical protein